MEFPAMTYEPTINWKSSNNNWETILHLSFPCLKLILNPTMNLMVYIPLQHWKQDEEIHLRNIILLHSKLLHIKPRVVRVLYITIIRGAITTLELNLGYTSKYSNHPLHGEP